MATVFDWDAWQEVFETLQRNRWRTLMTACGVFWGVFMLVVMLGFGAGLERGVASNMFGFVTNSVYIWGGRTSKPYQGFQPGRRISLRASDTETLRRDVTGLMYLAPRVQLGGFRDGNNVSYGPKTGNFGVLGDVPELADISGIRPYEGRFLNALDLKEERKVTVIGEQVREVLFGDRASVLGEYVSIQGVLFKVVGIYKSSTAGQGGDRANSSLHVPFSTFQTAFNARGKVGWFAAVAPEEGDAAALERQLLGSLRLAHRVHPDDNNAFGSFNAGETFARVRRLFGGIRAFTWFVSLATLFAGALGVSNIMLITVKERTREIGVRKALGAAPAVIVRLVLQETLVLTLLSGYAGLVSGVGVLEVASHYLAQGEGPMGSPSVDLETAVVMVFVLVAVGLVAGYAPARHAATIRPVVALRAEG